jgi:phage-related protein
MDKRPHEKPVDWIGTALKDLKAFPGEVREAFGYELWLAQAGEHPPSAKPLKGKALAGVIELRKSFDGNAYRTMYIAKLAGRIYVLHCFQKKSKSGIATPKEQIEIVKRRLKIAIEDSKGDKK